VPSTALAPTATSPLSLHDALPICRSALEGKIDPQVVPLPLRLDGQAVDRHGPEVGRRQRHIDRLKIGAQRIANVSRRSTVPRERSEEHTSELQSRENLVCRLLLEK